MFLIFMTKSGRRNWGYQGGLPPWPLKNYRFLGSALVSTNGKKSFFLPVLFQLSNASNVPGINSAVLILVNSANLLVT